MYTAVGFGRRADCCTEISTDLGALGGLAVENGCGALDGRGHKCEDGGKAILTKLLSTDSLAVEVGDGLRADSAHGDKKCPADYSSTGAEVAFRENVGSGLGRRSSDHPSTIADLGYDKREEGGKAILAKLQSTDSLAVEVGDGLMTNTAHGEKKCPADYSSTGAEVAFRELVGSGLGRLSSDHPNTSPDVGYDKREEGGTVILAKLLSTDSLAVEVGDGLMTYTARGEKKCPADYSSTGAEVAFREHVGSGLGRLSSDHPNTSADVGYDKREDGGKAILAKVLSTGSLNADVGDGLMADTAHGEKKCPADYSSTGAEVAFREHVGSALGSLSSDHPSTSADVGYDKCEDVGKAILTKLLSTDSLAVEVGDGLRPDSAHGDKKCPADYSSTGAEVAFREHVGSALGRLSFDHPSTSADVGHDKREDGGKAILTKLLSTGSLNSEVGGRLIARIAHGEKKCPADYSSIGAEVAFGEHIGSGLCSLSSDHQSAGVHVGHNMREDGGEAILAKVTSTDSLAAEVGGGLIADNAHDEKKCHGRRSSDHSSTEAEVRYRTRENGNTDISPKLLSTYCLAVEVGGNLRGAADRMGRTSPEERSSTGAEIAFNRHGCEGPGNVAPRKVDMLSSDNLSVDAVVDNKRENRRSNMLTKLQSSDSLVVEIGDHAFQELQRGEKWSPADDVSPDDKVINEIRPRSVADRREERAEVKYHTGEEVHSKQTFSMQCPGSSGRGRAYTRPREALGSGGVAHRPEKSSLSDYLGNHAELGSSIHEDEAQSHWRRRNSASSMNAEVACPLAEEAWHRESKSSADHERYVTATGDDAREDGKLYYGSSLESVKKAGNPSESMDIDLHLVEKTSSAGSAEANVWCRPGDAGACAAAASRKSSVADPYDTSILDKLLAKSVNQQSPPPVLPSSSTSAGSSNRIFPGSRPGCRGARVHGPAEKSVVSLFCQRSVSCKPDICFLSDDSLSGISDMSSILGRRAAAAELARGDDIEQDFEDI